MCWFFVMHAQDLGYHDAAIWLHLRQIAIRSGADLLTLAVSLRIRFMIDTCFRLVRIYATFTLRLCLQHTNRTMAQQEGGRQGAGNGGSGAARRGLVCAVTSGAVKLATIRRFAPGYVFWGSRLGQPRALRGRPGISINGNAGGRQH